jgi:hypothetical protein
VEAKNERQQWSSGYSGPWRTLSQHIRMQLKLLEYVLRPRYEVADARPLPLGRPAECGQRISTKKYFLFS